MRTYALVAMIVGLSSVPMGLAANQPAAGQAAPGGQKEKTVLFAKADVTEKDRIDPRVYLSADQLRAGETLRFAVVIDIAPGWHINTNVKRPAFIIPTQVNLEGKLETKIDAVDFPRGKSFQIDGLDEPLTVYENQVILFGNLVVPPEAAGQTEELEFSLRYQLCNDTQCLAPKTLKLKGAAAVVGGNVPTRAINGDLFKRDRNRRSASAG